MNLRRMIQVAGAVLCAAAELAAAQATLEIIPLRHRTADQVLPALRPLLEPGGTLSAQSNQLIVRTSPANLADIRRALEAIDRPARRLQISVRFDDSTQEANRDLGASGTIGSAGSRIELRGRESRLGSEERVDQRIQVLDGGRALIITGQSNPTRQRQYIQTPGGVVSQEIVVLQEQASGLEVSPRVHGDRVDLEVASQQVMTSVSARLGEWTEIGGIASSSTRDDRGIASTSRARSSQSRRVWVKVEEMPR